MPWSREPKYTLVTIVADVRSRYDLTEDDGPEAEAG